MSFWERYKKLIDLLILLCVVIGITFTVKYYLQPFISMILIFFFASPIYLFFLKIKVPDKISGALSILLLNVILLVGVIYLGSSIYIFCSTLYEKNIEFIENIIKQLLGIFNGSFNNLNIGDGIMTIIQKDFVRSGALSTGEFFIAYFIGNISAFFLLVDRWKFISFIKLMLPDSVLIMIKKQRKSLNELFVIQIILILVSTLEIIIGFLIFKIPNAFLLGIICGVLDLLPYVGTIIVFIPIIIYNIIIKNYLLAFGILTLFVFVQVVREILEAKFLSNKLELHPLLVLLSIYIGVKLFGLLGIFVGPIFSMLAKEVIYS